MYYLFNKFVKQRMNNLNNIKSLMHHLRNADPTSLKHRKEGDISAKFIL